MSDEISGNELNAMRRERASGQKLLNRYLPVKTLGRGRIGIVRLVGNKELERDVALKFLLELIENYTAQLSPLRP